MLATNYERHLQRVFRLDEHFCQRRTKTAPVAGAKLRHFAGLAGVKLRHFV